MAWRKVVEMVESIVSGLVGWCRRRGVIKVLRDGEIWESETCQEREDRTANGEGGGERGRWAGDLGDEMCWAKRSLYEREGAAGGASCNLD
jgi:hypothetical protein